MPRFIKATQKTYTICSFIQSTNNLKTCTLVNQNFACSKCLAATLRYWTPWPTTKFVKKGKTIKQSLCCLLKTRLLKVLDHDRNFVSTNVEFVCKMTVLVNNKLPFLDMVWNPCFKTWHHPPVSLSKNKHILYLSS